MIPPFTAVLFVTALMNGMSYRAVDDQEWQTLEECQARVFEWISELKERYPFPVEVVGVCMYEKGEAT